MSPRDLNILLLGQSGVGKSTWINSIANYIKYDTLEEAERGGVECVIPASFVVTYDVVEKLLVQIGKPDPNELLQTGKSSTKNPRTYTFTHGERVIRFIDTPGLGDSEGLQRDKSNMEQILKHISTLEEVHAICILLKSNETRLDTILQYSVKTLLARLHKSSAENVLFCFTNSRGSFYSPGDTLPILYSYLQQHRLHDTIQLNRQTLYCLDNEAFRFLCTLKYKEVLHNENDRGLYEDSWKKSVEETSRMLEYIKTLTPHETARTRELKDVQDRVMQLIVSVFEVTKLIQSQIASRVEDAKNEEQDNSLRLCSFEKCQLEYPRTVCTNIRCVDRMSYEDNQIVYTRYAKPCHLQCTCLDIRGKSSDRRMVNCVMLNRASGRCKVCKCSWSKHMKITSEIVLVPSKVLKDANHRKSRENLELATKPYKMEQKIIIKTLVKLNIFLRENAVAKYNDEFKQRLKNQIHEEEMKCETTGSGREYLEGLCAVLKDYEKEKAKADAERVEVTSKDIRLLEEELVSLELTGKQVKTVETSALPKKTENKVKNQNVRTKSSRVTLSLEETKKPVELVKKNARRIKSDGQNKQMIFDEITGGTPSKYKPTPVSRKQIHESEEKIRITGAKAGDFDDRRGKSLFSSILGSMRKKTGRSVKRLPLSDLYDDEKVKGIEIRSDGRKYRAESRSSSKKLSGRVSNRRTTSVKDEDDYYGNHVESPIRRRPNRREDHARPSGCFNL